MDDRGQHPALDELSEPGDEKTTDGGDDVSGSTLTSLLHGKDDGAIGPGGQFHTLPALVTGGRYGDSCGAGSRGGKQSEATIEITRMPAMTPSESGIGTL